ncbi:hypothetical protein [Oceanithermus sp.]
MNGKPKTKAQIIEEVIEKKLSGYELQDIIMFTASQIFAGLVIAEKDCPRPNYTVMWIKAMRAAMSIQKAKKALSRYVENDEPLPSDCPGEEVWR